MLPVPSSLRTGVWPPCRLVRTDVSAFFFSVPDALGVKRVAGQPRRGLLEGVEFTALQQHDEKNYFSGNTSGNVSASLPKNGRDV